MFQSRVFTRPQESLAAMRIIFFLSLYYLMYSGSYYGHHFYPQEYWGSPYWFRLLSIGKPSVGFITTYHSAWIVLMLFAAVGFLYRISTLLIFIYALFYFSPIGGLGGERYLFDYAISMLVVFLAVFALAPANATMSVDAFICRRANIFNSSKRHNIEYLLPILLMQLLICFPFLFSAGNRVLVYGLDLLWSDFLYNKILIKYNGICHTESYQCTITKSLLPYPIFFKMSYLFSQILELTCILAIFLKKIRWLFIISLVLFQVFVDVFLHELFISFIPLYVVWIHVVNFKKDDINNYLQPFVAHFNRACGRFI